MLINKISARCYGCGKEASVLTENSRILKWMRKEMSADEAFPELTEEDRSILTNELCLDCKKRRESDGEDAE